MCWLVDHGVWLLWLYFSNSCCEKQRKRKWITSRWNQRTERYDACSISNSIETQSFWSSLKEKMEGSYIVDSLSWWRCSKEEVINIFSVASGHLYERFLRIMMYSVTKNTSKSVKFWIIENFLSPSFKVYYNSKQLICSEFFLTMPSILDLTMIM